MQGQHENMLRSFYTKAIQDTRKYLEKSGYGLETCEKDDEDILENVRKAQASFREFWKIKITRGLRVIILVLAIPNTFPDTFIKIYLSTKDFQEIYPIPHLDQNGLICTRDPEVAVLNDTKPGEATNNLIEIAIKIVESGITKENEADYIEEFLAYWNEKVANIFLSIFAPKDEVCYLQIFKLSKKIFDYNYIVTDSKVHLEEWLKPFAVTTTGDEAIRALYLPIKRFSPYALNTDNDLLTIIDDKKVKNSIANYFNHDRLYYILIASFFLNGETILFGWKHKGWKNIIFKGFRKNHVPLDIRLGHPKNEPVTKIRLMRLDRERIFVRGGIMPTLIKKDVSIAVLGCGSLGSFLTMSLARCGISKLLLIDKECLSPENTPRHLCGFLEASCNMQKVEAVKKRVTEHFPGIKCNIFYADILELLEKDEKVLNNHNMVIVVLGSRAVERRINYLLKKGLINSPVLFLWVEPLGVGGHILYIDPKNGGCYDCSFDKEGNFLYSIPNTSESFQKRESGCQSTFLPYSSLTVEQFALVASKIIYSLLDSRPSTSTLFTWLGDIEEFEKSGHKINPAYDAQLSYRIIEKQIMERGSCNTCGNLKTEV